MGEGAFCMEISVDLDLGKKRTPETELVTEGRFSIDGLQTESFPNKKQAREPSNEDLKSEVSNPLISPVENACTGLGSSSQPWGNHSGNNHLTSTSCGNSSPLETLSDASDESSHENNITQKDPTNNDDSSSLTTSHVILEIPKHVSSTGIRKITFKFSKKKDDCNSQAVSSAPDVLTDGNDQGQSYDEEFHRKYSDWLETGVSSGDTYLYARNMELKMSKKVVPSSYPTNVKKLLSTGILDGARVRYISPKGELDGIIDGGGYLCGCSACNFSKILSAYEFEQHAGVKTRHPNNHIFLENGKPIYSIIQELKNASVNSLDEVIKDLAGSSINKMYFEDWKASLQQSNGAVGAEKTSYRKQTCPPYAFVKSSNQASEENCSLLLHNSSAGKETYMESSELHKRALKRSRSHISSGVMQVKKTSEGSAKKRDNDLHRLLFIPGGLPDGAELAYYVKGQKLLGGYKQGNGIVCSCCDREISPSQFEAHAGMAARRQPYRHIYTSNGLTLHDIAMSLASVQNTTSSVSDDMCAKCGDSGDLICCKSCPQAFHPACLGLQNPPEGSWCCPNCNIFGHGGNLARPIVLRLTRVVKTPEYEAGGCVICRSHDFSTNMCDERTVILCDQCEKEFHIGCLRDSGVCDLKEIPKDNWFCCDDCHRIFVALQNAVSSGVQMIPTTQLNIIDRKHSEKGFHINVSTSEVQWRILMGKSRKIEDLPLLSAAAAIFRECFDPIVAKSGRDLIPVMVYGRNISGQEFGGMYCILLIVRDIVISAGLLRVFGKEVAELPLVATSKEFQGKGYFQALFSCIQRLLSSLNVETLVLPATEEAESIWTNRFGFRKMSDGRLSKYSSMYQLTIFRGTSMLEKEVQHTISWKNGVL